MLKYQGSQSKEERGGWAPSGGSPAGRVAAHNVVAAETDAQRGRTSSPANSFVTTLMARAKLGQDNYGNKGLMDIHPDYIRSQLGYPPGPPSRFNRLDPAGRYADEEVLEDKYLKPTGEADVIMGSPQITNKARGQQSLIRPADVSQPVRTDPTPKARRPSPSQQQEMSSIPLMSHPDAESQAKEAQFVLQDITDGEASASQQTRAPQEVGLKKVIRRSGSQQLSQNNEQLQHNYPTVQNHINIAQNDYDHQQRERDEQTAGARTVRFAADENTEIVTFSPADWHGSRSVRPGLRKSQSEQNMPLQMNEERREGAVQMMMPQRALQSSESPAIQADPHGLENAQTQRKHEVSHSAQELQRQLQELRHMQHMQFPGNSPARGPRQNAQSSPTQGQSARSGRDLYNDYYSKYYERQKQQQALRSLNQQFAINQRRNNAGKSQEPPHYGPEQAASLGLGQPRNLAAFDLPLSSRMSREFKGSSKKAQQGQGGSVVDQPTGTKEKKYIVTEGATPRQQAPISSSRPSFLLKDGGQQRVEELGNQMRLSGLLLPEGEHEASLKRLSTSARQRTPNTPQLDQQNRMKSHRNSQGEMSGWRSSRASFGGGNAAQGSTMNLKAQPRKLSPAQAMSQGNRLHAIHRTHQLKKAQLREELDRELQEQMREKPRINEKSRAMVQDREKAIQDRQKPPDDFVRKSAQEGDLSAAFVRQHQECLTEAFAKADEERKQCTHRPKINRKSRTLIENRILQNLQKKAELYKMQKNPAYHMSQEGILIDMPTANRPNAERGSRQSPRPNLRMAQIQPNKYQIPLNKDAMAKSQVHQLHQEMQLKDRAVPRQLPESQNAKKDNWKHAAVEQLLHNDSLQSHTSHYLPSRYDQHHQILDRILDSGTHQGYQLSTNHAEEAAERSSQMQHGAQEDALLAGEAQSASAQQLREGDTINSKPLSIENDRDSRRGAEQTQALAGTLGATHRNMNMPRMSATFSNPVINLQSLQQQSSEKPRVEQEQMYTESIKAGTSQSLPTFQPASISKAGIAEAGDSNHQLSVQVARANLFEDASRDESEGHGRTQKSLRERIDERILKAKQVVQHTQRQSQVLSKQSSRPSIDAIARGRSRGSSRGSHRAQTAKSINEKLDKSGSKRSDHSNKSKRSTKSKAKAKNFIVLNAQQLARVQNSLSKKSKGQSAAQSKPNLFESKKIKIKKQETESRPAMAHRDETHEQQLKSIFDHDRSSLSSRQETHNNQNGSLAKLKQNADLNREIQLGKMASPNIQMQRASSDFYRKNIEWRNRIEQRMVAEKIKKDLHELDECSFTPRVAGEAALDHYPPHESVASGSQKSSRQRHPQVSSPSNLLARPMEGIHYADYHKFRAEAAPKTYRELKDYQKEVQTYLEKNAPTVKLRTERREKERQKSKTSAAAGQAEKSEQTTPRPPLPNSSRGRPGEKDSDRGLSTFRASNKHEVNALFQVSLRSLKNSDERSSQKHFLTESIEREQELADRARKALHHEIQSIATSPKEENVARGHDSLRQKEQTSSQQDEIHHHTSPIRLNTHEQHLQGTISSFAGQGQQPNVHTSKELSLPFQRSEEPALSIQHIDSSHGEVGQKVRRLGSLYMQRSAQETDGHSAPKYQLAGSDRVFDEQADPGKIMLDALTDGQQHLQLMPGAQQSSNELFPARSSRECAPPASGRSNHQITPRVPENNLRAPSSRQSALQFAAHSNDGRPKNPSSFDNTSLPVASTHRESVPLQVPFVPTPRTTSNDDQTRHSEGQHVQRILTQQEERPLAMNTARNQVSRPFPYYIHQMPSEPFANLHQYADSGMPPEEFTLSQPRRASHSDHANSVAKHQPRPSVPEHSSMRSVDWQVSQTSARREGQTWATPESVAARNMAPEQHQRDLLTEPNMERPLLARFPTHFEIQQRYGGYAEPIPEKESEEHTYSMNEALSNMSRILSASENTSQYDFLQHVNSIKDRQSHVTAAEDLAPKDVQHNNADPAQRARLANVPPRYPALQHKNSTSSNTSPMDRVDLYNGLNKDLALMQLRTSIMDKSLDFSREAPSVHHTNPSPGAQQNSLTTMSLEVNRQNKEVERIKDEIKRWNQLQAMPYSVEGGQRRELAPSSVPMSEGYQSHYDFLGVEQPASVDMEQYLARSSDV